MVADRLLQLSQSVGWARGTFVPNDVVRVVAIERLGENDRLS